MGTRLPAIILALAITVSALGSGGTDTYHSGLPSPEPFISEETEPEVREPPLVRQPVELIRQNPQLPNGCEATSLAMVLASVGFPVDKVTLYRDHMPKGTFYYQSGRRYGPDPAECYVGDAASAHGGWYCFEGPVIQAANSWLKAGRSGLRAVKISGLSQEELDEYARAGTPVVVWVTLNYNTPRYSTTTWRLPDGTVYHPYSNLHCVVLAGMEDDGRYRIADPITGWRTLDRNQFWRCFDAMGRRAVTVERDSAQNEIKKETLQWSASFRLAVDA